MELDLYKFANNTALEYYWEDKELMQEAPERVYMFVSFDNLSELTKILRIWDVGEGGSEVFLKEDSIVIEMSKVCDHFELDINRIFDK